MAITPEELPQLIAAAVKKAIAAGQITQKTLDAMLHKPVTMGLIPVPETHEAAGATAEAIPSFPIRLGYRLDTLQQLTDLNSVKGGER